jgi:hypothetical protein
MVPKRNGRKWLEWIYSSDQYIFEQIQGYLERIAFSDFAPPGMQNDTVHKGSYF